MTQTESKYQAYLSDFESLAADGGAHDAGWVRDLRERSLARFSDLGLPTVRRGNEKWKYTSIARIANTAFRYPSKNGPTGIRPPDIKDAAPWHDGWVNLVFVNGQFSQALSSSPADTNGVRIASLAEAVVSDRPELKRHLARYASTEDDGFTALNTAFLRDGAYVHIPEGESMDSPINIIFISTGDEDPVVSHPRVLVIAGPRSESTLIESYVGLEGNRYFTNSVTEIIIEDGAEIDHYRLLAESDDAFHVGTARVHQADNSKFSSIAFAKSAALARYDLYVGLDGPDSSCELNGLYMTTGAQHIDNLINIDHVKPHTTSRLLYKGVLDGKSRAVFGGTVWVREGAAKSDAHQSDKNLLLSPDAEIDTKPALYIYADDVKCGHGATAGNIDEDTVFYMRSRGLDLETASRLLIYGFASEMIEKVQPVDLRAYLEGLFLESLPVHRFEF